MGLFYRVTDKESLRARKELFINHGLSSLMKNGFQKMPFRETLYGRNNLGDYTYEVCRLRPGSMLEMVTTHISRGDKWIKIYLNIFQLSPHLTALDQLRDLNGLQFRLPPNSITDMRLRLDDFKGMPIFQTVYHKLKLYYSAKGFQRSVNKLGALMEADVNNIDSFIKRWYELHTPMITDWQGVQIGE